MRLSSEMSLNLFKTTINRDLHQFCRRILKSLEVALKLQNLQQLQLLNTVRFKFQNPKDFLHQNLQIQRTIKERQSLFKKIIKRTLISPSLKVYWK